MSSSKRSGIPVASSSSKSNIPTVKKTVKEAVQTSPTRSKTTSPNRSSLSPVGRSSPPKQVSKMADLPNDPKVLKTQIIDLQKKLDDRETTLSELSDKLALKSEECGDLMDERDTLRHRNSTDIQQITKDYMELQEKFNEEQRKFVEMEKDYQEEKENLQLELDVSKGEHELELSMLRKEIIDIRNKSQQRGIPLDVETDRLKANYEGEIESLKAQLQEQIVKNHDAMEKLEQNEFEILELSEMKKQYQRQIEVIAGEHQAEIDHIRRSYENGNSDENTILDALRRDHEASTKALKEQHALDLEKLHTEVQEQRFTIDNQSLLRRDYETRIKTLEAELQESKNSAEVMQDNFKELQLKHKEELDKLSNLHRDEIQRIILEHQTQEKDANKSIELQQDHKRQIEAYEHEIRSLKADLKKERVDFTEAREVLEGNLTDMEQEMKAREEKVRWELKEEHRYELENLIEEHEQALHDKDKSHKQEMSELKKSCEVNIKTSANKEATVDQQNETNQNEIEDLKNKYENDIEMLQETLENLQMEHEELQTEYDLVVNDLEGELHMTKLKVNGHVGRRRSSGALKEGIGKLKSHNEEHVQHLTAELKEAQKIISSLNDEIATLKENEKASLDNLEKVNKLEDLVKELEQGGHKQEEMLKELDEWKQSNEKLQNELDKLSNFNQSLQTKIGVLQRERETHIADFENKIANSTKQCNELEIEKHNIQYQHASEVEKLENTINNMRLEKDKAINSQKVDYEEKITELESAIKEQKNENQILESENQRLQDEIEDLQVVSKSEPLIIANQSFSISAENVDMIGEDVPEATEELKRDQKMKAIVEDFENKMHDLEKQLTKANQEIASKDNRLQSITVEMNVLRESLNDERNMVQSLEERCQKLLQNRDSEIEKIRKKYENGTEVSLSEHAEREAEIKNKYDNQLDNLRNELRISNEQKQKLESETKKLHSEVEMLGQQLVAQDAKHLAESIKQVEESRDRTNKIEEEMNALRDKLKTVTANLNDERLEHERKEQEAQFLVEQLKQSECDNTRIQDLVNELQKVQEENRTLRLELTSKNDDFEKREENLQKENRTKSAEIESLASMVDFERQGHKQKLEYFEKEIEKRDMEISTLSEMLEKEQANHEKTIHDTQKHIVKMSDLEVRNDHVNRENTALKNEVKELQTKNESIEHEVIKLKAKLRDIKFDLSKKAQDNDDLLNRSKKIAIEEMEQVQQLNRSLTQAEIHKEKLLDEVENSKQVLQKTQQKYQKTKDKLKVVTEKWQKEHSKLEEILLSPRVEMGLQTSLIQPEELEDTKTQLSNCMKRNKKLEEELKGSKQGLNEFKNDIQAMKRANNVLIKQNQVLYLETEALKKTVETLTDKADQLRQISVKLTNENENLQHENSDLKEKLKMTELNLSQIEVENHSFDALNKSANSELEEQKTACQKYEQDNSLFRDQNEFLLSQAKRLQNKVDELENVGKLLKNDLLAKDVELLKKDKALSEMQTRSVVESKAMVPLTNSLQGLHQVTSTGADFQVNLIPTQEPEIKTKTDDLSLESAVPFANNGIDQGGSKGYVGLKSYQVIEWDTKQRKEPETQITSTPLDGFQLSKIKQLEFDSSNYLGSAYWDTLNLLKNMKSSR